MGETAVQGGPVDRAAAVDSVDNPRQVRFVERVAKLLGGDFAR